MTKTNTFLDSELNTNERSQEYSKFHILPVPLEKTVSYGLGTSKGPEAIILASNELERYTGKSEPCLDGIFTHPFINCEQNLNLIIDDIRTTTKKISSKNKIPVTIGGEHSLTYGAVNGIYEGLNLLNKNEIGIIQIDAHADLRKNYQKEKYSHASVMYLLSRENYRIAQFGVRAISLEEEENRSKYNITSFDAEVIHQKGNIKLPDDFPKKVYISFDVDGLDPSIMPATGTPVPGGLGYYESLYLIKKMITGRDVIGFDLVEFSPIEKIEAYNFTAATLIYKVIELINLNKS
jgi:agmatinase|tara:strand:- start:3019 stop:3897 length:879 start_codon:yes stop_codon:yes gene_type:complete